jgi:hypothetical protein
MGTAFVKFHLHDYYPQRPNRDLSNDITHEIYSAVFRAIIEEMEREQPDDKDWVGYFEGAYGMKFLYVGTDMYYGRPFDYGPAFLRAVKSLQINGPPDYYPMRDLEMFYKQLADLEREYTKLRPPTG